MDRLGPRYKVFVINLRRATDRLANISKILSGLNISFERIEAADAQNLSESEINKYYSKQLNKRLMTRYMSKAEIACYISHIYCWQKIAEDRLDFAITIEDDAIPNANLCKVIDFLKSYKGDFGYLQLGYRKPGRQDKAKTIRTCNSFEFVEYKRFSGETPIDAVSYNAAKTLLKNCIPFGRPVDSDSDFYWHTKVKRLGLRPYSYIYSESEFESTIAGRNKNRIKTKSLFAISTVQDIYYHSFSTYNKACAVLKKLNAHTPFLYALKGLSSIIPYKPLRKRLRTFCLSNLQNDFSKQNILAEQLRKNYVEPYLKGEIPELQTLPKKADIADNSSLWQFWYQGQENISSDVVKISFKSADTHKGTLKHIVIDKNTISKYVDIPDYIYDKTLNAKPAKMALFSDILRLYLLYTYGGVWADATCYFSSDIPNNIKDAPFFMFQRGARPTCHKEWEMFNPKYFSWDPNNRVNSLSSFIVVKKQNPLIGALLKLLTEYIKNEPSIPHYFILHILLDVMLEYKYFRSLNCEICDDTIPHLLLKNINKDFSQPLWEEITKKSFVHKLNYAKCKNKKSIYQKIKEQYE